MRRRPIFGYAFLIALTALGLIAGAQQRPVQATTSYLQTFDGMPVAPDAYSPPGWDVATHSRNSGSYLSLEPMDAQHGSACEAPPATHALGGDYPGHVFQCHDHAMTAMNAGGYGVIYLTPPALADFTTGETVIRWDMSTLRTSGRDWVDLWITPYDQHLQLPLDNFYPDLQGNPPNAVHVYLAGGFSGVFKANTIRAGAVADVPGNWWTGYETWLTPDAARRDTFEVRLSRTHLKVWMPTYNHVWIDRDIANLGWDQGVVQFGHHSYNPTKLGSLPGGAVGDVLGMRLGSVTRPAESHTPTLDRMSVDAGVIGIVGMSGGAMCDAGSTINRDFSSGGEVSPLAVDQMGHSFQMRGVDAGPNTTQVVDVQPTDGKVGMAEHVRPSMSSGATATCGEFPVAIAEKPDPDPAGSESGAMWRDRAIPVDSAPESISYSHQGNSYSSVPIIIAQMAPTPTPVLPTSNTWHWDNASVDPAVPFTITRLTPRYVNSLGTVSFPAAQAGDTLDFSAVGLASLSFDGGVTFVPVSPQPSGHAGQKDHFASYFVSLPVGATSVQVKLAQDGWYGGPLEAKDFAVWRR